MVIPVSGAGMPVFVYILPYYANELALGLTAVGVIFFCGRFLDIFTDPLMGFFVDRYQTKKYKHKHWIIISVPLVIFSAYMIFFPISEFVNNNIIKVPIIFFIIIYWRARRDSNSRPLGS